MYKRLFESKEADNAILALQYIMTRHANNVTQAKMIMTKLKKNLKDKAYNYLKKFGDPDASGKYNEVKEKWDNYVKDLTKEKKESFTSTPKYKRYFKETENTDWNSLEEATFFSKSQHSMDLYKILIKIISDLREETNDDPEKVMATLQSILIPAVHEALDYSKFKGNLDLYHYETWIKMFHKYLVK